jgi:hypothetical protein
MESQWPVQGLVLNPRWVQDFNGTTILVLGAGMLLPCLIPLILRAFKTIIKATIKRKMVFI